MSRYPYLRTAGCVLAAALVIAYCLGANLLSKRFILGAGHAGRPIGVFLILYGVGWLGLILFSAISPKGGKGLGLCSQNIRARRQN